ncbi:MAG: Bacterial membrane protein YfhO [Bacteroidetes bacterium ADurb.Bin408]|nr:MAG: Bacterial membrane protein YfhO [Bacteroidetes bacterium ADurb.Bin408]
MNKFVLNDVFKESTESKMIQHVAFQAGIQILVSVIFAALLIGVRKKSVLLVCTALIVVLEMTLAVQLNAPYTVYYPTIKQNDVYQHHKQHFTSGFPKPDTYAVNQNTNARLSYGPFWRNMTNFHKQISAEGFTSLVLKNFNELSGSYPALLDSTLKHPPLFMSGSIGITEGTNPCPDKEVWLESSNKISVSDKPFNDSLRGMVTIQAFKPTEVVIETQSESPQVLVFQQNYYPGWQASMDGVGQEILKANKSLISLYVPAGRHIVKFYFSKPLIVLGFFITALSLMGFVVFLVLKCVLK